MQTIEHLSLPTSEYDYLKDYFNPRRNGGEFEWRDQNTGRYFVIKLNKLKNLPGTHGDLSIATLSLRDIKDKSIFSLPYASSDGEKPKVLSLTVSAVDGQDQFARESSHDELSYMWIDYNTSGIKHEPHGYFYDWGTKYDFKARGHYDFSTLPEQIDFDRTVSAFGDQLKNGDFSTPTLFL